MILVTGATGTTGSEVVRALVGRGERVRAFVRDPDRARGLLGGEVELAVGDFVDPDSLRRALAGATRLVLSCADDPRRVEWERGAIDAAAEAGVERIVRLSTVGAEPDAPVAFWDWHGRVDEHLRASRLPAVILQSSFYMSNLFAAAAQVAAEGRLYAPAAGARVAMVDPRDVGAVASVVVTDDGHAGRTYALTGPEALTWSELAATLSAATGRGVEFVDVPDDAARDGLVAAGLPPFVAAQIVAVFGQLRAGVAAQVTDAVERLTGNAPRSFAAFARDHAGVFAPAPSAVPTA